MESRRSPKPVFSGPATKHVLRLLAVVLVFALVASACGDDSDSDEATDGSSTAADASGTDGTDSDDDEPVEEREVDPILTTAITGGITLGEGPAVEFDEVGFEQEFEFTAGPGPALLAVWNEQNFVIVPAGEIMPDGDGSPTVEVTLVIDGVQWTAQDVHGSGDDVISASGEARSESGDETLAFSFEIPVGVGSSTFEIVGTDAIVRGDLGSRTFEQVEVLIKNHPEVDTLVLQDISGSVNDAVNVETARLVRNAGLNTHVPADGQIFSGGVDLFAAGVERTVDPGAVVGVHSWCCGPDGKSADEFPEDSPVHAVHLAYSTEMLGEEGGRAYYFFTIQAAPFDGMHEMTMEELSEHLLTN